MSRRRPTSPLAPESGSAVIALIALLGSVLLIAAGTRLLGDSIVEKYRCQGETVRALGFGSDGCEGEGTAARWTSPPASPAPVPRAQERHPPPSPAPVPRTQAHQTPPSPPEEEPGFFGAIARFGSDAIHGGVYGDYGDCGSAGCVSGQVVVGLIPIAGQIGDARDVSSAVGGLWHGEPGAAGQLGLAAVGLIPGVGDLLKASAKAVKPADDLAGRAAVAGTRGAAALGDLRPQEIADIQRAADDLGADIWVTGSAARGQRRGVGTDLPLADFGGSKKGTRSDIDYAVKSDLDDAANDLSLPDVDPSFGVRGVDYINTDSGPVIRFSPDRPPELIPQGGGKIYL